MGYNPRCSCGTETVYMGNKGNYAIYVCPNCGKKYKIKNL